MGDCPTVGEPRHTHTHTLTYRQCAHRGRNEDVLLCARLQKLVSCRPHRLRPSEEQEPQAARERKEERKRGREEERKEDKMDKRKIREEERKEEMKRGTECKVCLAKVCVGACVYDYALLYLCARVPVFVLVLTESEPY